MGIVYKTSHIEVTGARIILPELDYQFAGRPPLEVDVRVSISGQVFDAKIIVLHAKASPDSASWARRVQGGGGAKGPSR